MSTTRLDVENEMSIKLKDNNVKFITPVRLRDVINKVLDYLEAIDLGETIIDLDEIYRRIDDSYSRDQIDALLALISLTPGPQGEPGEAGQDGAPGAKGEKGDDGSEGAAGPKGDKGDDGNDGAPGPKGDKGDTGNMGATGAAGAKGESGISVYLDRFRKLQNGMFAGAMDGVNKLFTMPVDFDVNTLDVYRGGALMSEGGDKDYETVGTNQIRFKYAPQDGENLVFKFLILE